jgi:DNA-binding winged helix-turn-helix (wHTH) protein
VAEVVYSRRLVRFGTYEVDLPAGDLKKCGVKLKLSGQPFQVLAILLEQPGTIVTREELQKRLWPDTFVDVDHNLNAAINKIREVLGDSAENPRYVETLPRRGYRFVAPVEGVGVAKTPAQLLNSGIAKPTTSRGWALRVSMLIGAYALLAGTGFLFYKWRQVSGPPRQRPLTRVTFNDGLQIRATWSPDADQTENGVRVRRCSQIFQPCCHDHVASNAETSCCEIIVPACIRLYGCLRWQVTMGQAGGAKYSPDHLTKLGSPWPLLHL